jgi:hypothetical protein
VGFYIRKSIKAGPFRFNLSSSGLGVSTGVPGFRVGTGPRGNYVHMGRNGIYYRASLGGGRRGSSPSPTQSTPPYPRRGIPAYSPSGVLMEDTTGATAFALEPTGPDDLVAQLNTAGSRFTWWWPVAVFGAVIALNLRGILAVVFAALLVPLCIWLYFNDQARRTVVLFYEVEDEAERWFQALIAQWPWLSESQKLWRVTESGDITTPYLHKRNAGASTLISSVPAAAGLTGPSQLKTNIQIPSIVAGKSALYFLPDRLLVRDGKRFTDVSYEHLQVAQRAVRFIESGPPPADATMVDTTWTYVNKDGGPDRRFNNNRQLPVMHYGRVVLTTATGLFWIIQVSRYQAAEPVAQVISLGSTYADQIRRNQDRSISIEDAQIAARADRQNRLFLKGDAKGIYGQYPPAHLQDPTSEPAHAQTSKLELVSRAGKPRLWRDQPGSDDVMIQVDIRPIVPDTRWWSCFAQLVAERNIKVKLGPVARGAIATSADNPAAVPAVIAAIDSVIDDANELFINTHARDEVETYVAERRAAKLAEAQARAALDLESLAELLAKPDPVE